MPGSKSRRQMFLGGAYPKVSDTVRPPSVKGAIRFWWRALNWARVRSLNGSDKTALQQLHKEEGELFGGAHVRESGDKENIRALQSKVALRISEQNVETADIRNSSGLQYLLGMGLYSFKDGLSRTAIKGCFTLKIHFASTLSDEQCRQVEEAVVCFGLLGALGSRARHGWGSVSITNLQGGVLSAPATSTEYKETLNNILAKCLTVAGTPPYSAFCSQSRLDISARGGDAMSLLQQLGNEQQMYRSWGQHGKIAGKKAERNFPDDHNWADQVAGGETPKEAPVRAVFGLPHNYFLSSKKVSIGTQVTGNRRRAAPLLTHIHQFPNGSCMLVQTLLQSLFLPPELKMEIKAKTIRPASVAVDPQWQVIHNFMDRFSERETLYGH